MASKVVGKRVTGESPGWTLYIVAAVLVVLSVRSFVTDDPAWGGVYAFIAVVVALISRTLRGDAKRMTYVMSPCPVCGVERKRGFAMSRNERTPYESCGACIAYLRLDLASLEVSEEAADATGSHYWVRAAQYQAVVPRSGGPEPRFEFVMPRLCAVCGSPDAPELRRIDPNTAGDAGVLGAVASEAANLALGAQANRSYESNMLSSGVELDLQLRDVEMYVCAKHTSILDRGIEYRDGDLIFYSYPHYKAFCELNHITAEKKASEADGPPKARVVAS
jgi:hypothetical protein